jgi:hypothetical protein
VPQTNTEAILGAGKETALEKIQRLNTVVRCSLLITRMRDRKGGKIEIFRNDSKKSIKIAFTKKLKSRLNAVMLIVIQFRIFCPSVCSLKHIKL